MSQIQYENLVEQVMYILDYKHSPQYENILDAVAAGANPGVLNIFDSLRVHSAIHANFMSLKKVLDDIENSRGFDKLTVGFKEEIFKLILDEINEEKYGGKWFGTDRILDENWVDMSQYSDLFSQENKKFCLPRPYVVLLNPVLETRTFVESKDPVLDVNLGKQDNGKSLKLNLAGENLNLILLLGTTGSGKSVFHFQLYKELIKQNLPGKIGFIFIDNTRVDFNSFPPSYLIKKIADVSQGGATLNGILEEVKARNLGQQDKDMAIIVHIEECDQFAQNPAETENFYREFIKYKQSSNVYVVYSTSRPAIDVLPDWLIKSADLKVVFNLASEIDCKRVLGTMTPLNFKKPGERILIYNDHITTCLPFTNEELKQIEEFENGKIN